MCNLCPIRVIPNYDIEGLPSSTTDYTHMKSLLSLLFWACLIVTWVACDDPSSAPSKEEHLTDTTVPSTSAPNDRTSEQAPQPRTILENVTGTYTYGDQEDPDNGGGYLVVEQLEDQQLKFQLDLNRGAPNFNSGYASGTMVLKGNTAIWTTEEYNMDGGTGCTISFLFTEDQVVIDQEQGSPVECGFGNGVLASGTYVKQNNKPIFREEGEERSNG